MLIIGCLKFGKCEFNKKKKSSDHLYDDWDTIRNFQPTEIVKREGLDVNLYQVRKLLNMLSDKNYDKISNDIMEQFDFVIKNKTPKSITKILDFITAAIFNSFLLVV